MALSLYLYLYNLT